MGARRKFTKFHLFSSSANFSGDYKIIESSFKLLDFLLKVTGLGRDRVRVRDRVRSTFHRVDIPANRPSTANAAGKFCHK